MKTTQEQTQQNLTPEKVQEHISSFTMQERNATSRKLRCEELMRRKSAKRWNENKKQRMIRRLMTANKQVEQAGNAIVQLRDKLEELKSKKA